MLTLEIKILLIVSLVFSILVALLIKLYRSTSKKDKLSYSQEKEMKSLNTPYKCKCEIVSRKYQLNGDKHSICPHCGNDMSVEESKITNVYSYYSPSELLFLHQIKDDREFPFAPKMSVKEFIEYSNHKEEIKRIEKEKKDLIETDKELEAWQNLQLKKLEEYQRKAEEIKKELNSDNKIFGKMKWTNDEL